MVRCGNLCLLRPRLLSTYRRPSGNWRGDDNHYYYGDETRFMEFENATRGWYERNKKYINRLCVTGAIGGAYYWYHLEKTPITGRSRFISVGTKEEQILGSAGLDQIIKEHGTNMLSPSHPIVRRVQTIVDRLLKALDPELRGNERAWRVHVINSSLVNAMVLPTGDIFVFTGIIPVAQDDAGLAAIIGHEVS